METPPERTVSFERGLPAKIIAIDGTWHRPCSVMSISERSATLIVEGPMTGLSLNEFFLSLSSFGATYRRCKLEYVNGEQVGVHFLNAKKRR